MAILNEAFRSPDHKTFFLSFILGCPQDFNFAWPFWYGWVETGLNGQNGWEKLKSCGHPRIKLKKCFVVAGDLKVSLRIAAKKSIHKTSSNLYIHVLLRSKSHT